MNLNWPKNIIDEGIKIIDSIDFNNVTPIKTSVLSFLEISPYEIKVVIIGQDPYPTKGVANGRAFAVNKNSPLPKSLVNLFKEIKSIYGNVQADETLELWTHQGVLLLNTSLTTIINKPNSHKKLWNDFIKNVIIFLDDLNNNIFWVLWGQEAQKIGKEIKGYKIIDAHPSPLSFHKRKGHTFKELDFIKW